MSDISKVAFEFNPFEQTGIRVADKDKQDALDRIEAYVKEQVLSYCGDGVTPVSGGEWKRSLSAEYKKEKLKVSGVGFANMELKGDMLNDLDVVQTSDETLSLQIEGEQAPVADGHNNFSGDSKLPPRQFIPNADKGQTFKRGIWSGIKKILLEFETPDETNDETPGSDSGGETGGE